jgi:hypothetical protein
MPNPCIALSFSAAVVIGGMPHARFDSRDTIRVATVGGRHTAAQVMP